MSIDEDKPDHVIRKGGYFYRPNRAGYTSSILEAGRYTRNEAEQDAKSCRDVTIHHESEFAKEALEPGPNKSSVEMTSAIKFMRRNEAAAYLQDRFGMYSSDTLAKLACIGGGPPFRKLGRIPLYTKEELDAWVDSRLSPMITNTSQLSKTKRS